MEERLPKSMKHEKKERKKSPGPIFRNTDGFLLKKKSIKVTKRSQIKPFKV